eukprot:4898174-Amphidinium_carterae.1
MAASSRTGHAEGTQLSLLSKATHTTKCHGEDDVSDAGELVPVELVERIGTLAKQAGVALCNFPSEALKKKAYRVTSARGLRSGGLREISIIPHHPLSQLG